MATFYNMPSFTCTDEADDGNALGEPHAIEPIACHTHTAVLLHGFMECPERFATRFTAPLLARCPGTRFVFLRAPTRRISCWRRSAPPPSTPPPPSPSSPPTPPLPPPPSAVPAWQQRPQPAWHDYLTDHSGAAGRPDLEEDIDVTQLVAVRRRIHRVLDAECERLADAAGAASDATAARVALGGFSQGAATALDAALTYRRGLAGCYVSRGYLPAATPVPPAPRPPRRRGSDEGDGSAEITPPPTSPKMPPLHVCAFHGADDRVIAALLAMQSYARLLPAFGAHDDDDGTPAARLSLLVEPGVGHHSAPEREHEFKVTAFSGWGFVEQPQSQ